MEKKHIRHACKELSCQHIGFKDYIVLPNQTIILDGKPIADHEQWWVLKTDVEEMARIMFHTVRGRSFRGVCSKILGRDIHTCPLAHPWAEEDLKRIKMQYDEFSKPEHIAKALALAKKYEAETKHWHTKRKYA